MTGPERTELAALREEMRDEFQSVRADVAQIKLEMAEWRGAIRFIKVSASFVGFGGLALLVRVLAAS